ncbi:alpha/beta fold hydrolase [Candidatus Dojkabacteria bacterium]|nr:alpha/beta fold hydrolase [Candidatus Dojkabacteria bacterium]
MKNIKKYGKSPYEIVVLHGGPGAPGSAAPIAEELSSKYGVMEPYQSENSVQGQIAELNKRIENYAQTPLIVIGWSWGAWLGFLYAAKFPQKVKKLILVSSGPFEERFVEEMMQKRMSRLTKKEKEQIELIQNQLEDPSINNKDKIFGKFGQLFQKTDNFAPISSISTTIETQFDIYKSVWTEAARLRRSGALLNFGRDIKCPTVVIHGDYDPVPYDGVREPLSEVMENISFHLLEKCGHDPWNEMFAREKFFQILYQEID